MLRRNEAPVEVDVPTDTLPTPAADALTSDAPGETPPAEETALEGEEGEDPVLAFHQTIELFATGITVVTVTSGGRVRGVRADTFVGVSVRPPLILVAVDDRAETRALLDEGTLMGISVLAEEQEALSRRFITGPGESTPEPTFEVVRGTPLVEDALAQLVARVTHAYEGGDHTLVLGHVEYAHHGTGIPFVSGGGHREPLSAPEGSILGALPPAMREKLLSAGEEHEYAEGDTVIRQGERGADAFVILSGRARVVRDGLEVARLGAGQFFGEVAMFDGRTRTADVVAESQLRCIALSRATVQRALRSEPDLSWRILEVLAGRIRG
jgi:flavin reductase (DIM6/NTAB) family NADH-FMN oxidoreductase RutF